MSSGKGSAGGGGTRKGQEMFMTFPESLRLAWCEVEKGDFGHCKNDGFLPSDFSLLNSVVSRNAPGLKQT